MLAYLVLSALLVTDPIASVRPPLEVRARDLLANFVAADFHAVAKDFNESMKVTVTPAILAELKHQMDAKVGDFRADLLVESCVLLELKCARLLDAAHEAQLLHYLKSTQIEVGLLLNFGLRPQFRRLLFDNERKKIRENPCKSVAKVSA